MGARVSAADRLYGVLLRAYPAAFREAYGGEMALLFRDRRRDEGAGPRFWLEMTVDLARSALPLRVEAMRGRRARPRTAMNTTAREVEMAAMSMAILTIMIGALEAAGAFTEFWSGVQHPAGSGPWVLGSAMGVAAAGLLLGSGVALLRGSPGAVPMARGAAVTCIVVFLLISYVLPMMGYFAQILGIGFPIVLLLHLRRGRGEAGGAPSMG
jgi:hypothetical protein